MPYLRHLSTNADLITAPEEIRSGFVALALERSRRATPFVEQARALKVAAMRVNHPNELLGNRLLSRSLKNINGDTLRRELVKRGCNVTRRQTNEATAEIANTPILPFDRNGTDMVYYKNIRKVA